MLFADRRSAICKLPTHRVTATTCFDANRPRLPLALSSRRLVASRLLGEPRAFQRLLAPLSYPCCLETSLHLLNLLSAQKNSAHPRAERFFADQRTLNDGRRPDFSLLCVHTVSLPPFSRGVGLIASLSRDLPPLPHREMSFDRFLMDCLPSSLPFRGIQTESTKIKVP